MAELLFLVIASFCTSVLSGMIGLAGGSILMVLILNVMPPAQAIPFHGVVQLVATSSRVVLFRGETAWGLVGRYCVLLIPGVAVGMWLFRGMPAEAVTMAIGLFVLGALFLRGVRAFGGRDTPLWFFYPFGFAVGLLSIIVGGVGVLFGPFVIRQGLNKEGVVGTQSTLAAVTHLAKVAAFGMAGFVFAEYRIHFALVLPSVVLGTVVGRALLGRFNERYFMWLYQTALVLLSLKLVIWDGVRHWLG